MKIETSKKLCTLFALTNFGLFAYNGLALNLYIGIVMVVWVVVLEFVGKH